MASLVLNDQPVDFALDPETPLLWALRDIAGLTGTKYGCGSGECGGDHCAAEEDKFRFHNRPFDAALGEVFRTIQK